MRTAARPSTTTTAAQHRAPPHTSPRSSLYRRPFYEYLIKQWLLTGKQEEWLRTKADETMVEPTSYCAAFIPRPLTPHAARDRRHDETMVGMAKLLVQARGRRGTSTSPTAEQPQHKMDHLACFIAATLAIGAQDGRRFDAEYMALAEGIGETCYQMYARMKTGLAPEFVQFTSRDLEAGRSAVFNIGRPETVESLFVLWYYTQDPRGREMGWNIFTAFETYAATGSGAPPPAARSPAGPLAAATPRRAPTAAARRLPRAGWTALPDVNNPRKRDDKMESFVLAET